MAVSLLPSSEPELFKMRAACARCGCENGTITQRGAQDVVRCLACEAFQYNAPRTETGKAVRTVQTVHAAIKPKQRAKILFRASGRCELCGKRPSDSSCLHVSHIVSVARGLAFGLSDDELNAEWNLVCCCDECNLGMGQEPIPLRLVLAMQMSRLRNQ